MLTVVAVIVIRCAIVVRQQIYPKIGGRLIHS